MEAEGFLRTTLRRLRRESGSVLLAVLLAAAGLVAGIVSARTWSRHQLDDLVMHVSELATGFEAHDFTGLAATRSDETSATYAKLKQHLFDLTRANKDDHFVYVVAWDPATDKVTFLADSAKPGSKDESHPGDPYANYDNPNLSPGLRRTIRTGIPSWEGPERDEFGSWYSAFVRLNTEGSAGPGQLYLGVDRDSAIWTREVTGLGTLVTLACWLVAGAPLAGFVHSRSKNRQLEEIEALQRANAASAEQRMTQALSEVERYQLLARTVPAGILRFDRHGRALYANEQWRSATRSDPDRLGRWGWLRLIPRDERRTVHQTRHALGPAATTLEGEVRLQPAEGPERWIQFSVARESESTWLLAFVDRTRDKLAERHLEHKVRLDALAGMAHKFGADLRNALTPVALSVDSLARELGPQHPGVRTLENGVRQATRIVQQLIALMDGTSGERKPTDLTALLQDIETQLRATAPKQVHVLLVCRPEKVVVEADPAAIRQVALNLGQNAIEAMGKGGTLTLDLARAEIDDSYARSIPGGRTGQFVVMTVSDTGPGIPPALQARILEPFFTTKAERGHTGLGLATVARTVAEHGGFLYCQSAPDEGTSFRVYLPLGVAASPAPCRPEPAEPTARGASRRVLVCDDEPMVRAAAELVLTTAGFLVRLAPDGVDALCAAAEPDWRPDVVIADFEMPGLHGLELARSFQALLPGVPVVLTTGRASPEQRRHAEEAKVRSVLEKPFSSEQLLATVLAALGEAVPASAAPPTPAANWQI